MSEIRVDSIGNESNTGGPVLSGITTFSGQQYFIPPKGTTAERPSDCPPGSIRFNTDTAHLEYWNGLVWLEFETEQPAPLGSRHLFGGAGGPDSNVIEYVTLATTGNSRDFGDLHREQRHCAALADTTRGLFGGGYKNGTGGTDTIEFVTIATLGNAIDFGDRSSGSGWSWGGTNDGTRGLWIGGTSPLSNDIDFVTIQSTGNTTSFGTNNVNDRDPACLSSKTRAIIAGNHTNSVNIDYVTIQSTGNSIDFGELPASSSSNKYSKSTASNGVRGVIGPHGYDSPAQDYQYFTISTLGNTQNFGDKSTNEGNTGSSGKIRGINAASGSNNIIEFITIATTGDAQDFGDLVQTGDTKGSCTNANGGL